MDLRVRPGDDFGRYCNGTYLDRLAIPPDRSRYGVQDQLRAISEARTRLVIESTLSESSVQGSEARKIADCYLTCLEQSNIDAKGVAPLRPQLQAIAAIADREQLAAALGGALRLNTAGLPLRLEVRLDWQHPDRVALYLNPQAQGLPTQDYYLDQKNPDLAEIRRKYLLHIAAMLRLAGFSEAESRARGILALETQLAGSPPEAEAPDFRPTCIPVRWGDVGSRFPGLAWGTLLGAAQVPRQEFVLVTDPTSLLVFGQTVKATPLAIWRDYLTFRTLESAAPWLPKALAAEHFDFHGRTLKGQREPEPAWKQAMKFTRNTLPDAVAKRYVAAYVPPRLQQEAETLARNILQAMDLRLANCTWLNPRTRNRARAKMARVHLEIGYPKQWSDYSKLTIIRGDALGNAQRAETFEFDRQLARLNLGQASPAIWRWITPMMVGGFSDPVSLSIFIPAGSFQAPYLDLQADRAMNYGGLGAVIGHEICHLLDDTGRHYNEQGQLEDWWTPEDVRTFKRLSEQLAQQVSAYEPIQGVHVLGDRGRTENLADLCGLQVALDAYRASLGKQEPPILEGFTGLQRFLLGFAQLHRVKYQKQALLNALLDGYTPAHLRPNQVRNLEAWYQAFPVKPGDALYLPPEQRIQIW